MTRGCERFAPLDCEGEVKTVVDGMLVGKSQAEMRFGQQQLVWHNVF